MSYNIFISHSSKDYPVANNIDNWLKQIPNVTTFLSEETIIPGILSDKILNEIKICDVFLLLYSINSHNSQYVQNEIGAALSQHKTLIILSLDGTKPNAMLQGYTYYQIYDQQEAGKFFPKLHQYISEQVKAKANNDLLLSMLVIFAGIGGVAIYIASQK